MERGLLWRGSPFMGLLLSPRKWHRIGEQKIKKEAVNVTGEFRVEKTAANAKALRWARVSMLKIQTGSYCRWTGAVARSQNTWRGMDHGREIPGCSRSFTLFNSLIHNIEIITKSESNKTLKHGTYMLKSQRPSKVSLWTKLTNFV